MHQRPPADPGPYSEDDISGSVTAAPPTAVVDPTHGIMAQQRPATLVLHEQVEDLDTAVAVQGGYHGDAADDGGGTVDLLDDIFGGTEPGEGGDGGDGGDDRSDAGTASHPPLDTRSAHPSDMNRLRHDHSTAGYREGLTAAKAASVQAGFDEGYGLGAALGSEVGELLGLLEGLAAAAAGEGDSGSSGGSSSSSSSSSGSGHDEPLGPLLARARQQLTVAAVFGPVYFAADGTWLYEAADHGEPTVFDVAKAHPLVHVWRGIIDTQLHRFGVRWGGAGAEAALAATLGLQGEEDEEEEAAEGRGSNATATATATATTARAPPSSITALDW